jgi:hypothetical protein
VRWPWRRPENDWQPLSKPALIGWLAFFALFLLHAATDRDGFLLLDHVNLVIHEAGHPLFSWGGWTLNILGGTLLQLLVPFFVAAYFFWHRQTTGLAFAAFWFFQNFLNIARYMADARTLALPLVGSGDHDWEILFGQWGLLVHDRAMAGVVSLAGWCGMVLVPFWLLWMAQRVHSE